MPLLNDELSLWEIAFRWAGQDPDRLWLRLPLPVRDYFRTLMDAIQRGHLDCTSLMLTKWSPDTSNGFGPEFFIRHHLDAVEACVWGKQFDRKLLKWASIERWALQQWCERQGVPLPEFWFPPGWNLEYAWPLDEDDLAEPSSAEGSEVKESDEERSPRIDQNREVKIACQRVASYIWSQEPDLTIKEVAIKREIQNHAGGSAYALDTVQEWIKEVDPRNPAQKRGPKRKNNSRPAESTP